MRTYIHANIHTSIHPYIHTYIHSYVHMCIRTYVHTYVHQYMQAHTYASINKYLHIYMAQSTPTNNHACRCIDKISTASLKHIKNHSCLIHLTPTWLIALSPSFVCCLWRANRPKLSYNECTRGCPTLLIIISSCCVCCLTGPLLFIMVRGMYHPKRRTLVCFVLPCWSP